MDQPLDQELAQHLELLRDRIKVKLNDQLEALLVATDGEEGDGPKRSDDLRAKLSSTQVRGQIENAISTEVDQFFSRSKKEELFSSAVSYALPAGPAKRLEKAIIEEITRVMLNQFEAKSTTLRQHLSTIPDVMINRRWIQRTFEGLLNDVAEKSPHYIQSLDLAPVFSQMLPDMLNHVDISKAALVDLKRSLNQEVQATLDKALGIKTSSSALKIDPALAATSDEATETPTNGQITQALDQAMVDRVCNELLAEFSGFMSRMPAPEPMQAPAEPVVAESFRPQFTASSTAVCKTLVIHCSDPRFTQATREFLLHGLNLSEGEYAKIAIPGSIQALTLSDYLPKFTWAVRKWIGFMDELLEFERVICISHDDCKWYDATKFKPVRRGSHKQNVHDRQIQDLHMAQNEIDELTALADVELYFMARPTETTTRFERVS